MIEHILNCRIELSITIDNVEDINLVNRLADINFGDITMEYNMAIGKTANANLGAKWATTGMSTMIIDHYLEAI